MTPTIHQGDNIKAWLKLKKYSVAFVAEQLGKSSRTRIYELLKQESLPLSFIKMCHYILGIPLDVIYGDDYNAKEILSDSAFNNHICFKSSSPEKDDNYAFDLDKYHKVISRIGLDSLKKTKQLFIVVYYPTWEAQNEVSIASKTFQVKQAEYFKVFQEELYKHAHKKEAFKYSRCEQIEHSINGFVSKTELIQYLFEHIALESLTHICWCMKNLGDAFNFYVTDKPYRKYTFWLTDNTMILEYARYNKKGAFIPDANLICSKQVEEDASHLAKFMDIHKKHITHIQSHPDRYRVTKTDLLTAMYAIQDSLFAQEKSIKDTTESQWLKAVSEVIKYYGETKKDTSTPELEFLQRTLGKKDWLLNKSREELSTNVQKRKQKLLEKIDVVQNHLLPELE